jgi:alpha,alpha-trehalase
MTHPQAYRPLADYAAIGNTHTAALISRSGAIDWCCLPHFDDGAVFCRLLDANRGGYFRIGLRGEHTAHRRYAAAAAVLETEFSSDGGTARLTDFMHSQRIARSRLGFDEAHCHRILRCVDGLAGSTALEVEVRPTFDFARQPATWIRDALGWWAQAGDSRLLLQAWPDIEFDIRDGNTACALARVRGGERLWFVLSYQQATATPEPVDEPEALLAETLRHWKEWSASCTYGGPYAREVRFSAHVLKLLTFGPTGALVAAPTTSLPEELGGVRNWDYRYCWLRDSALVLRALMSIGYHEAAMDFFRWLEALCEEHCERLQIMYRIDGGCDLPEQVLEHLEGYGRSAPVRVGNAAAGQRQLDVYGHVLDAVCVCHAAMPMPLRPELRRVLSFLADQAAAQWREPDQGLWETRGPERHFVSSKLMCWVALDRAIGLADSAGLEGDVGRWVTEREAVRRAILEQGYHSGVRAFSQAFGRPDLDASALLIPLVGFLPADDARVVNTVAAILQGLTAHGLVYRYRSDDGVPGSEATLVMCSFWMVENLALQGRLEEACKLFERVCSFSSDLGLLAEEIDPVSGQLLGNYPQGFSHLALIGAALAIDRAQRGRAMQP